MGIHVDVPVKQASVPKLYYSIREVSEMFDEEPNILRHWEREFSILRPNKNRAGNRIYTERDLRILRVLKVLLREQRRTTAEVRQLLADGIPAELESLANDTSIEQRYREKRQAAQLQTKLTKSGDTITLTRAEAEFLLATLKRIAAFMAQNEQ